MIYRHLDHIGVKSNLPDVTTNFQYTPRTFRTSQDICKYDCSFEESLLQKQGQSVIQNTPSASTRKESISKTSTTGRSSYLVRNEEIMRSLAELKEEFTTGADSVNPSIPTAAAKSISSRSTSDNSTALLRMKAETAAELYFGDNDAGIILNFIDFYVQLAPKLENTSSPIQDHRIVKAFNLFSQDLDKSSQFLEVSQDLADLGFDEDKVDSALILYSNDREAALDFLMKN